MQECTLNHYIALKEAKKNYVMQKWTPPRTMTKDGIFYPHLSTHLSAAAQRKEIREIFKLTRHPLLTEKMAELLYRTLHSGFWMGPNKCNKKRGDTHTCMVCGQVESVLHTFCECYKITRRETPTSPSDTGQIL